MMILGTLKDLDEAHIGDWDLNMALHNYLSVLDENYGHDRNIYEDDGGFAIIISILNYHVKAIVVRSRDTQHIPGIDWVCAFFIFR